MKQTPRPGGLRLTKSLGQNFLHDANQLRRIVAAAELSRAIRCWNRPGLGPLTELLLDHTGEVLAMKRMPGWRVARKFNWASLSPASPPEEERERAGASAPRQDRGRGLHLAS